MKVRNAALYKEKKNSFHNFLEWTNEKDIIADFLKRYLEHRKHKILLDIGAGNGAIAEKIIDSVSVAVLLEPSEVFSQELQQKFKDKALIVTQNFENFETDIYFDAILLSHVFRYLEDAIVQLERMKDMLTENGELIFIINDPEERYTEFYDTFRGRIYTQEQDNPTTVDAEPYLDEAGFEYMKHRLDTTLTIPTLEEFMGFLDFVYSKPTEEMDKEVLEDIRAYISKNFGEENIEITFHQNIFLCKAKK